ncbi:MAG TPA: flagellar biosynthetic protein FliR [Quisquiliibacterium sp.]|nr:flagellar biosynthetic protein FliR [Quisquiliibacterium sp.]HPA89692.1 flagellar biosynthetic protein FliR [Quisquiliibacterium sp.]HQN10678.1 flagellar biosynthetic protein FliR [Quisquiliibacterium sp.]HQP66284.1 flagellar biosynthetic protein FliR [Quisquiliibacterium sp.]
MITFSESQLFGWMAAFLLPLFRVLAMMSSAPILSNRAFTVRARVGLAALVALVVAPFAGPVDPSGFAGPAGLVLVAREVLIGLTIGFVARLLFAAFEIAGEAIGLQMGLSFAGFFDPQQGQANAVGRFVNTIAMLAFVALNGPLAVIVTVVESFSTYPAGVASFAFVLERTPVQLGGEIFALALNLALPFMALLLFSSLSLGVISRVAPQLQLMSIGFPVTIFTGLLLLTLGLPMIEAPLNAGIERMLSHLVR